MQNKKIMVLGAAGRVGMQIASECLRRGVDLVLVDIIGQNLLQQKAGRLRNDARLAVGTCTSMLSCYGEVNLLDKASITEILAAEKPHLVINYAIPITWDAAKRLPNYNKISEAGLGALTPIQVLTPLLLARAIVESGIDTKYMVGNLPDITVPIITAIARQGGAQEALCGAGNVGLNQVAFRSQLAIELGESFEDVDLALVSHHVHWVAPREPGYSNEGPFLARVLLRGEDITDRFSDLRAIMNRGVENHYEADAAFSSTTGILASRIALALLDDSGKTYQHHAPAPNGLPGGYPVKICDGEISLNLPLQWKQDDAVAAMLQCHRLDGVEAMDTDGTVHFTDVAQAIMRREVGFDLPAKMAPADIEEVALAQIACLRDKFSQV